MTENDRKLLAEACGFEWHGYCDDVTRDGKYRMCQCGLAYIRRENHINRTFSTPDDWEMVRGKVVVPKRNFFVRYIKHPWLCESSIEDQDLTEWFLTLSPEARCQLVADWLKERE